VQTFLFLCSLHFPFVEAKNPNRCCSLLPLLKHSLALLFFLQIIAWLHIKISFFTHFSTSILVLDFVDLFGFHFKDLIFLLPYFHVIMDLDQNPEAEIFAAGGFACVHLWDFYKLSPFMVWLCLSSPKGEFLGHTIAFCCWCSYSFVSLFVSHLKRVLFSIVLVC